MAVRTSTSATSGCEAAASCKSTLRQNCSRTWFELGFELGFGFGFGFGFGLGMG